MSPVGWDAGPVVTPRWFDRDELLLPAAKLCSGDGSGPLRVQAPGAPGDGFAKRNCPPFHKHRDAGRLVPKGPVSLITNSVGWDAGPIRQGRAGAASREAVFWRRGQTPAGSVPGRSVPGCAGGLLAAKLCSGDGSSPLRVQAPGTHGDGTRRRQPQSPVPTKYHRIRG